MKTTLRLLTIGVGLCGLLAWGACPVRAQEQADAQQGPATDSTSTAPEQAAQMKEDPHYVVLLNSDRVVTLNEKVRYRLLYGMNLIEGYDDGIVPGQMPSGVVYTMFNPSIGLMGSKTRAQYIIQYSPTVSYFSRSAIGTHAYHQADVQIHGQINRGWGWDFQANNRYGSYTVALLSPFRFDALGNITAVNANAILVDTLGDRLDTDATIGLHWQPGLRNRLAIAGTYNYSNFFGTGQPNTKNHFNRGNITVEGDHVVSRKLTLSATANALHIFGGRLPCTYYGMQLGVAVHPTPRTDITVGGGPQFGDPACTASRLWAYDGFFTEQLTRTWSAYLTGQRTVTAPFHNVGLNQVGVDQISEAFAAGVMRRVAGARLDTRFDGGYIHTQAGNGVNAPVFKAHGAFISPQVAWHFTRTLTGLATYRRLYQVNNQGISGLTLNRNQFFITLEWRPDTRELGGN